jgi:hypothetical protein
MLASLKDWVDAAHFYRHEEGTADEVAQPPFARSLVGRIGRSPSPMMTLGNMRQQGVRFTGAHTYHR